MSPLHPISDFIDINSTINNSSPAYYYQGYSHNGELLQLPRTSEAEAVARGLMRQLAENEVYSHEGKMYGILLVELPTKEKAVLKAFSGLLNGKSIVEGWVPPIPGREKVVLEENRTLAELEAIKQEIIQLKQLTQREEYEAVILEFEKRLQEMSKHHQISKQQRDEKRDLLYKNLTGEELNQELNKQLNKQLKIELEKLKEESRQQGVERKLLKRKRDEALQPLQEVINDADMRVRELKQQRKQISRKLQAQMHAAYSIMNFMGNSSSLQQLMPQGLPTGTGDCCTPKLLHYAATNNLKPMAIAEFWWGESTQDKKRGEFYGACMERCQPLMGFLLSGLKSGRQEEILNPSLVTEEIPIIYEDEWLIAVDKPSGLLSVPGRYHHNQDSVVSRLSNLLPDSKNITAVHRLDMDTSGILLLTKNKEIYRLLSQQFEQRLVSKVYEAVLLGSTIANEGVIELPLWGNPEKRPYQEVNYQYGKPCITKFKVLDRIFKNKVSSQPENYTRIEFIPLTGRTHQLRVHAADTKGLAAAILGDKLYGCESREVSRLHLHARELTFKHPYLKENICFKVGTPF
ncbi:ribosomal large chain pseudouridine synthase A [Calothrix parasitica NIES-267]|uniref:RNA pseudouridylate synthase n=1 Tax=Calothrix parasitica NIES-267 TaxID=1973488 RepID=A0A1Z4LNB0_9CYAN|nr:ribosomal large chain pseudouridine synthase A [Calothrix parasitica NIES-267]